MVKPPLSNLFQQFFNSEKAGGLILICCTAVSLIIANSSVGTEFTHFWHLSVPLQFGGINIPFNIEEWINDGLMSVFFLLVGLEIERELYIGELSSFKNAILPVLAAGWYGGAGSNSFHVQPGHTGTGRNRNPHGNDIAFSLGVLSLIGKRIPYR
jgi:NhaA family Na+:H+ antiporter